MLLLPIFEVVGDEPHVDDDEIGSLIGSVEYSLEPAHVRILDPVIDRHRTAHVPRADLGRESYKDESRLSYEETDQDAERKRYGR